MKRTAAEGAMQESGGGGGGEKSAVSAAEDQPGAETDGPADSRGHNLTRGHSWWVGARGVRIGPSSPADRKPTDTRLNTGWHTGPAESST